MPELPEVAALAEFLAEHAAGQHIAAVTVSAMNALTTYDPPVTALVGRTVTTVTRHGKFLDVVTAPAGDRAGDPAGDRAGDPAGDRAGDGADDRAGAARPDVPAELHLVLHLARAGWLRWSDAIGVTPPKMGGPIALRVRLSAGGGFDVTEAGTKRSVTAAVVTDPHEVAGIARLGPDALGRRGTGLSADELRTMFAGNTGRIKTVITDQTVIAGIGNAYSDEILHTARMSPFATAGSLAADELARLADAMRDVLTDAVRRTAGGQAAYLKGEKRSGLQVHGRAGLPCPVCGDTIAEVSFTDRSFQYCPTCQTGGRHLADRRRSRLLR